jgi:formate/nitrite transporter FocA (FNT family)
VEGVVSQQKSGCKVGVDSTAAATRRGTFPVISRPSSVSEAGEDSPHLDEKEQKQAAERAAPGPLVIHEIVREEGQAELERHFSGLAWSGLAAGLSIGFSFVAQAYLQAGLPDEPWRRLVAGFGYSLGFLIVVLGRQQLFTETTLTALIPTLTKRDLTSLLSTLRVWGIVLAANLIGTLLFAFFASRQGVFDSGASASMVTISTKLLALPFWEGAARAVAAGWLIGLMVWLLPASGSARPLIIIMLTYVVSMCEFPHIIAGSVEAAYAVFTGHAAIGAYFVKFLAPTLLGNVFGGTALAALLNHAPIAHELNSRGQT